MSLKIVIKSKKQAGHTKPKRPPFSVHFPGRLRVCHIQWLLGGISHSAFYSRIKKGLFPKPDGRDPRPYWNTATAKELLKK
jgi:hypothetical protein